LLYLDYVVVEWQGWLEEVDQGRHCAVPASLYHHGVLLLLLLEEAEHTVGLRKCTLSVVLEMVSSSLLWLLAPAEVHEVHKMAVILCIEYSLWIIKKL
jgi:hypothetical protein